MKLRNLLWSRTVAAEEEREIMGNVARERGGRAHSFALDKHYAKGLWFDPVFRGKLEKILVSAL